MGDLVNGEYHIPVVVSTPGHPNRTSVIILSEPMYDGDYIDFEKQVFAHYRTDITSQIQNTGTDTRQTGISSAGNLYWKSSYQGWGGSPRVTDYFELEPDARYEISKVYPDRDFSDSLNINLYDENKNRTRTIVTSTSTSTVFKKFSYDANGHITGTANVTASDILSLNYVPNTQAVHTLVHNVTSKMIDDVVEFINNFQSSSTLLLYIIIRKGV